MHFLFGPLCCYHFINTVEMMKVEFRAPLNFGKFKLALNPPKIFFKLCQKLRLVMLIKC